MRIKLDCSEAQHNANRVGEPNTFRFACKMTLGAFLQNCAFAFK